MNWKLISIVLFTTMYCQKVNQIPVSTADHAGTKDSKVIFHFLDFNDSSIKVEIDLKKQSLEVDQDTVSEKHFIQKMNIQNSEEELVFEPGLYSGKITLSYRTKRPILFNFSARTVLRFLNASSRANSVKKNECKIYDYNPDEDKEIAYICSTLDLTQENHIFKFRNNESKKFDTMWTSFVWGIAVLGIFNTPPFYGFFAPVLAGVAHFKNEIKLSE
ncbi:hypothetical protein CH370_18665 [Leptospira kmetyi]|uniref:hypothetical protein n=1 Tax=Leptospira kmetyi TaxID=408139 RepID=UPI000C2A7487|nr:hypothetical protein [Leptospira kmetyi]PJZ39950.1 hypothetical protein CH370_18665 [Leptospira kmetyi]